jgi:hypothetical protein
MLPAKDIVGVVRAENAARANAIVRMVSANARSASDLTEVASFAIIEWISRMFRLATTNSLGLAATAQFVSMFLQGVLI